MKIEKWFEGSVEIKCFGNGTETMQQLLERLEFQRFRKLAGFKS